MLDEKDKVEVLSRAKADFKHEVVRRVVEKAFADDKERINQYVTEAAVELNKEFKKLMPI